MGLTHAGVRMENVQISKHPLEEKLALLSKAILVGPPECVLPQTT